MKNLHIYLLSIIISFVLLVVGYSVSNHRISSGFIGIGCSVLAASLMAIFIENAESQREKERKSRGRKMFFAAINNQLTMMIGRMIWFAERLEEDDFDWTLNIDSYLSLPFRINAAKKNPEKTISFDEATELLYHLGDKYNIDNMRMITPEQADIIRKMFKIHAFSAIYLLNEANNIKQLSLQLDLEDFISIEKNKDLMFDISLAIGSMDSSNKNYKAAIECLVEAAKIVREVGGFDNVIKVGLHGSMSIYEL